MKFYFICSLKEILLVYKYHEITLGSAKITADLSGKSREMHSKRKYSDNKKKLVEILRLNFRIHKHKQNIHELPFFLQPNLKSHSDGLQEQLPAHLSPKPG